MAEVGISGIVSLILPAGMDALAALLIMRLKVFSASKMFVGAGSFENFSSVMDVNFSQSAFLKFTYVLLIDLDIFRDVEMVIIMGRWSDPRLFFTSHFMLGRRESEARETSGEVGCPLVGSLVG